MQGIINWLMRLAQTAAVQKALRVALDAVVDALITIVEEALGRRRASNLAAA